MPRVAIVTPHMTTRDAVCNDVCGMYEAFIRRGFQARIYASDWNIQDRDLEIWPVAEIKNFLKHRDDILVYHFSMGWQTGCELLRELDCRKIIKYHNVTPPQFFSDWSEEYQLVCQAGRDQVADIARADCDLYLSASAYNMRELVAAGAPEAKNFVVPPFNRLDDLIRAEPDFEILDRYRDGRASLLMVGTVFPNKGHTSLLEAFAVYVHHYSRDCRLFVVGKENRNLAAYARYLRQLAAAYGIHPKVVFTGEVDNNALKTYYLTADLFVTLSEHEGFCVPIVESMALGIPVIALGSSAIPETVCKAGLVWEQPDPGLFAESFSTLLEDESARSDLAVLGRQRYEQFFSNQTIEKQLFETLAAYL